MIDTVRIADAIARDLEQRILEGSLRPGERLASERDLAAELGVSRPSLREALQRLVSKGLLRKRQGGGTYVTDTLQASFADPWRALLGAHPALRRDMLELRDMLEAEAARLAAERATAPDRARIEAALAAMEVAYGGADLQACIVADAAFHQIIAESTHNVLLAQLSASLSRLVLENIEDSLQAAQCQLGQWQQLREQHRAICRAVVAGDPDAAAAASHDHIAFLQRLQSEVRQQAQRLETARRRAPEATV